MLILINGPLGCGKTDLVEYAKTYFAETYNIRSTDARCKDKLHRLTMEIFGVPENKYWEIYNSRKLKETRSDLFRLPASVAINATISTGVDIYDSRHTELLGDEEYALMSLRLAMIFVSECLIKPNFGESYFGEYRMVSVMNNSAQIYWDDSTGFPDELKPISTFIPLDHVLLVRVHGRGKFDSRDSRDYILDGVLPPDRVIDVWNDGELIDFLTNTTKAIEGKLTDELKNVIRSFH